MNMREPVREGKGGLGSGSSAGSGRCIVDLRGTSHSCQSFSLGGTSLRVCRDRVREGTGSSDHMRQVQVQLFFCLRDHFESGLQRKCPWMMH